MSEEDIARLIKLIDLGIKLFWRPFGEDAMKPIHGIGSRADEPGPVAFLSNGEYIALWGTEPDEVFGFVEFDLKLKGFHPKSSVVS